MSDARSASSQMQRDVDGQDDPFQKLMAVCGAVSLPDELFCGREKALSIYMRGQGAGLEFRSFPSKGQAQARQCGSAFGSQESS